MPEKLKKTKNAEKRKKTQGVIKKEFVLKFVMGEKTDSLKILRIYVVIK